MKLIRAAGWSALLAVVGAVGYWAGQVALEPPEDPLAMAPTGVVYTVHEDTIGREFAFSAVGEWVAVPAGRNATSGTVTSIETSDGALVSAGDVLYTLDLRPVVVARGDVPMFRALDLRSTGADVQQLQNLLSELGFYDGEIDGVFGGSTQVAVKDWQETNGVVDDGVVQSGDIVFLPDLPARVILSREVRTGVRLGGGEVVVLVLPESPDFQIPLASDQASLVPLSADVEIEYAEGVWIAHIERAVESEQNQLNLILAGSDGGPVCRDDCAEWVDLTAPTHFRANVIVVPETTGIAVPVAGILSGPGNDTFVEAADGKKIPVEIVASANGLAIVEGLEPDTAILLPPEE